MECLTFRCVLPFATASSQSTLYSGTSCCPATTFAVATIDSLHAMQGGYPLHSAALVDDVTTVNWLLSHGADRDAQDKNVSHDGPEYAYAVIHM